MNMKTKILNTLVALLFFFGGMTTFVSCADPLEDEVALVRMDMSELSAKADTLGMRITFLEENGASKDDVESMRTEIEEILKEIQETKASRDEVSAIESRVAALEATVRELSKSIVTSVIVQETLDCVVGTINLPGFNPGFLAAYVGENKTGMPEFPIAGSDYNADPDGNVLLNKEINVDPVWNSGKNSYLVNGEGNAGKIYFSLNPLKANPKYFNFALVNSNGNESPIQLTNVAPSDHLITFAIGKHGNGLTRGDDIYEHSSASDSEMTYLYEADATVALDRIEEIHFDYTRFGYQNIWDAGQALTGQTQGAAADAQNLFGRFQYIVNAYKAGQTDKVLEASLKTLQDFYNGVYSQRSKLQKQALRVTWDNGANGAISPFDITTVTINPLNYKQMILLDKMDIKWNLSGFDGVVQKVVSLVLSKLPEAKEAEITWDTTADGRIAVYAKTATTASLGAPIGFVDLQGDNGIITNLSTLTDAVNEVLRSYNNIKGKSASGIMTRVSNYLNNATAKFKASFDGMPAWKLTQPVLLFDSQYGITRLQPLMKVSGEDIPFIMTSMTEEYIVPAYMKYVAVLYDGKVLQSYLLSGNEKIVKLTIPNEECEIVYQTCDFYGNTVTKRYPLNRK
jgi:ElaB/YqjD/DUF883 family membrane-anchored ribosome-binding protein